MSSQSSRRRPRTRTAPDMQHPTDTELLVLAAAGTGTWVDLRTGDPDIDDSTHGAGWGADRTVRAEVLIELLSGARKPDSGVVRSVKVRGARISGVLDLESAVLTCPLYFEACYFERAVNLDQAEATGVRLLGCCVPGVSAIQLRTSADLSIGRGFTCQGDVTLLGARIGGQLYLSGSISASLFADDLFVEQSMICRGFSAAGIVRLPGARIGGQLLLSGAYLANEDGVALAAENLSVGQNMSLDEGFTANGAVLLNGAHIGGRLFFSGARLTNKGGLALAATGLSAEQGAYFNEGFSAEGEVRLSGADVGGQLDMRDATLTNIGGPALQAEMMKVAHTAFLNKLTANGGIHLSAAQIGGQLILEGALLTNENGMALSGGGLVVGHDMHCRNGFVATGEVSLTNARIGALDFRNATLANPGGLALVADGLTVESDLVFNDGFTAEGSVRIPGAHVGGYVYFEGASLTNMQGWALAADHLTVKHSVYCNKGFSAAGEVTMAGAHIGGQLVFDDSRLSNPGGITLRADRITVDTDIIFRNRFSSDGQIRMNGAKICGHVDFDGSSFKQGSELVFASAEADQLVLRPAGPTDVDVILNAAQVNIYHDNRNTWTSKLDLDGFTYNFLANEKIGVRSRLEWLALGQGDGYSPAIYDQLANAYRRSGQVEAARRVGLEKQKRRRRELGWSGKIWNWLLYLVVGYGYHTWWAWLWLVGLLAAGSVVFSINYPAEFVAAQPPGPQFHAIAYALDALLPIVDLGQQRAWLAHGAALIATWVLVIAGWILVTTVIAGLTNALKRD